VPTCTSTTATSGARAAPTIPIACFPSATSGSWSTGFRFRHADGTPYGTCALPDPTKSEAARIAFSALCNSGYKQSEARAVIDSIRDRITTDLPIEQVVRLAFMASADLPGQRHVSRVRESLAEYRPSRAVA
jgi:hypothetical protein